MANPYTQEYNATTDTVPYPSTALTGTVSSTGVYVVGAGTLFLTEISNQNQINTPAQPSNTDLGYLVDLAGEECRRITGVIDDTHLTIDRAFASDLSAATVSWCSAASAPSRVRIDFDDPIDINGASIAASPYIVENGNGGTQRGITPLVMTCTGRVLVTCNY